MRLTLERESVSGASKLRRETRLSITSVDAPASMKPELDLLTDLTLSGRNHF